MKRLVMVLFALVVLSVASCKKDEINDPTGLYNVTTQYGSTAKIGTMTCNKFNDIYKLQFSIPTDLGSYDAKIVNGNVTIDMTRKVGPETYTTKGTGRITNDGQLSLDLTIKWGMIYHYTVIGNKAK